MLARRVVTAADMPASETEAKMDPPAIRLEALLATFWRAWADVVNLIEMCALSCHHRLLAT
jgi:hypothetical protein